VELTKASAFGVPKGSTYYGSLADVAFCAQCKH